MESNKTDEHEPKVVEKRISRKILGAVQDEAKENHNKEIYDKFMIHII